MTPSRRAVFVTVAALALLTLYTGAGSGALILDDSTTFNSTDGLNVSVNSSVQTNTVTFDNARTINFRPQVKIRGQNTAGAQVENLSGDYVSLTEVNGSVDTVTATGAAGQRFTVRSEVNNLTFRRTLPPGGNFPITPGDGVVDFVYKDFDADTTADIAIEPVAANRQFCAVDADTDTELDCATASGSGVVRFDSLTLSSHRVLLQSGQAPDLNDTSASPQPPNEFVRDRTTDLEIDVTDREFPNDTVTVEFFVNGNSVGTDSLGDAGTASVSSVSIPPGQNEWHATATDKNGLTDRSRNFTVSSPGIVTVRNNNDNSLLNNETVTAEFYTNSGIETKSSGTGEIDMLNLPNQDMRVDFAAKNFSDRSFQFFGIDDNKTVYMAPSTNSLSTITFTLDDRTGNFPPTNTTLIIEESKSGSWTRVVSQKFKSQNEVVVDLDPSVTHRLRVRNAEGDTRVLGTYSPPSTDETKELTIEESVKTPSGSTGYRWDAEYKVNESSGNDTIQFEFSDPDNETTGLEVAIYEEGNRSNNTISADNFTGPLGSVTVSQDVPPGQENKTWVVNASADRGGEIQRIWQLSAGRNPIDFGLDERLRSAAGVLLLLIMGFIFGGVGSATGGIVIPLAGGLLWYVKWLPAEIGLPAIIAALFIGVANSVRSRDAEVV